MNGKPRNANNPALEEKIEVQVDAAIAIINNDSGDEDLKRKPPIGYHASCEWFGPGISLGTCLLLGLGELVCEGVG